MSKPIAEENPDAWKGELIASSAEAFAFLKRELAKAAFPNYIFRNVAEAAESWSVLFRAKALFPDKKQGIPPYLFTLDMEQGCNGEANLDNIDVWKARRGCKIGAKGVKAALGCAYGWNCTHLLLTSVCDDGPLFWPMAMGAVPSRIASISIGWRLKSALVGKVDVPRDDRDKFKLIAEIDETKPFLAWRLLSQALLSTEGSSVREQAFRLSCPNDQLIIVPSDPWTREIIQSHTGVIPPFRSLLSQDPLCRVVRELEAGVERAASLGL